MEVKGVNIEGKPLYTEGQYSVYKGWIDDEKHNDIPHYLIINMETWVVEGSAARLFEARGMCSAFSHELELQNKMLAEGKPLVEPQSRGPKWDLN